MLVDKNNLPILTQRSEEGFIDALFRVDALTSDNDHYYFSLLASHEGRRVGCGVKLLKRVRPAIDRDMNLIRDHVYREGVSFLSLGAISDRFVSSLAALYGLQRAPLRMTAQESFTAMALQQENTDLERDTVKFKLFGRDHEAGSPEDYYESFFTVSLRIGLASWSEKDPGYREPLIRAMTAADGGTSPSRLSAMLGRLRGAFRPR